MLIYKPFVHKLRLFPIIWLNPFEQFKHLLSIKWLCLLLISIGYQSNAQDLTIEPVSNYKADGTINIYGRGNLTPKIPYENITGNAFWQTEWKPATLFGRNSKERWEQVVKLNMATNEIYFKDKKGEEQVVNAGYVKQVLFHAATGGNQTRRRRWNGRRWRQTRGNGRRRSDRPRTRAGGPNGRRGRVGHGVRAAGRACRPAARPRSGGPQPCPPNR